MNGVTIILLLLVVAAGQIVTGVYLLFGTGWTLIAMGLVTLGFAAILSRGMRASG